MRSSAPPADAGPVSTASRRERRLGAVIAEYLQAGPLRERWAFLEEHQDLVEDLDSFFANEDWMRQLAGLACPIAPGVQRARGTGQPAGREAADLPWGEIGEFELLNEIARGGMGLVFKARHRLLNRIVAIKTIRSDVLPPTDETFRRLHFEAGVIASLDHPNIVPLYEVGEHGGCPYLVLKHIPGGDLERHAPRLREDPRAVARLLARVARTLHYAHLRGVLHCDLKPSNILLDARGEPHITDFGLARCVEAESGVTQTGVILGTPSYMSPEQVSGRRREVTDSADIYGLGAVLYKLLTGRPPFLGDSLYETLWQVRQDDPTPPGWYNPLVDRELEAICLKCLEKDPARRYRSAKALARDLERWMSGRAVAAGHIDRRQRLERWYRRNRAVLIVSAASVALTAVFALAGGVTATVICHAALAEMPPRRAAPAPEVRRPSGRGVGPVVPGRSAPTRD